jgi:hypothetical protein
LLNRNNAGNQQGTGNTAGNERRISTLSLIISILDLKDF